MQTIKKIGLEDVYKLGIVFTEEEVIKWGLKNLDKIDLDDCLLIDGGKDD